MESVLTVRLDGSVKERGTAVMREHGYSPSQAVRKLFDYAIQHDALPFQEKRKPSKAEAAKRIAAFDALRMETLANMTDDQIRNERLRERYGLDAG